MTALKLKKYLEVRGISSNIEKRRTYKKAENHFRNFKPISFLPSPPKKVPERENSEIEEKKSRK